MASSSWQTLDPKSPSVPSITLHLTNMHMYIAWVSTEPGGSKDTFPPSPWSVSAPWFVLQISSPVSSSAWGRQQSQAAPRGLGMALTADQTTQLCAQGGMWGAAIWLGCSGDVANVARPLFCPRNNLKRVSYYTPWDVLESTSPKTPFAMSWLNFNGKEGVVIIASVMSFTTNIMVWL